MIPNSASIDNACLITIKTPNQISWGFFILIYSLVNNDSLSKFYLPILYPHSITQVAPKEGVGILKWSNLESKVAPNK